MSDYLPFIVAGLTTGSVYGLAGVGLVLSYKTSGVFNFAYGALATVSAYTFYELTVQRGMGWQPAALVAILGVGIVLGLALELVARRVQTAGLAVQVATTVGMLLIVDAAIHLIYGNSELRLVPVFLGTGTVDLAGTTVGWADIWTFAVAVLATLALAAYFRFARRGTEMRAVVDNPELLSLFGTSPVATRRLAWTISTVLVATSGVLFAPLLPLDPNQLTLLVVAAFGAAAVGAFRNMLMTLIGGLAIGVGASLSASWFTTGLASGIPASLPFIVLFVVLLIFPKRHLVGRAFTIPRPRASWQAPARFQLLAAAAILLVLLTVPGWAGLKLTAWTSTLGMTVVLISLCLLVRTSGQVSLAHMSFMAIGAVGFSRFAVDLGLPWLIALLAAGLVAVPIGAVLAIPAIRLTGLYLALATFGFAVLLQNMFFSQPYMFGPSGLALPAPRPDLGFVDLRGDKAFYYLTLVITFLTIALVVALVRGRLGRLLRGGADSRVALETGGANVMVTRVLVFCVSAFLASIGGALCGMAQGTVSADSYPIFNSLLFFVLVMIVLGSEGWAALSAAVGFVLIPAYLTGETVTTLLQLLFGVSAVVLGMNSSHTINAPAGLRRWLDRVFGTREAALPAVGKHGEILPVEPGELAIRDITVRFGGLIAVDGAELSAATGQITGLICPDGAGKTTTFNVCSGLQRANAGAVWLNGTEVTRRGPSYRAGLGLGRTFQKMELLETLSVADNVAMGAEAPMAGARPLAQLWASRGQREAINVATAEALDLCGLTEHADRTVSSLSTGQRRLVELARAVAGNHRILLLDEPSSGLDHAETALMGEIMRQLVARRGVGILIVEHDMSLVLGLCDQIHVLDFGRPIFSGTPDEVEASPVVRAAYLGDDFSSSAPELTQEAVS